MTRDALPDNLARSVIEQYSRLPANGKPRPRTNNVPTWTVLAGFSLYRTLEGHVEARCVSIGTGLKALPHSKLPLHGDVLHDSHAEVIARRGLKLWLYRQLELATKGDEESFLERKGEGNWGLKAGWKLGLWISTLPCGDASTYSLSLSAPSSSLPSSPLSHTPPESNVAPISYTSLSEAASLGLITTRSSSLESTPSLELPISSTPLNPPRSTPLVHRGRVSYSSFSTLRTKPGRADSPPTTSHSCSDKIAMWSLLGVQGGLLSTLGVHVELYYISVSGVKAIEEEKEKIKGEIRRAVGGRLEGWRGPRGERVRVPEIGLSESIEFEHSREVVARMAGVKEEEVVSCQESISWAESFTTEVITNGIRQGSSSKRKPGEALGSKARSRLSKLSLFQRHLEVCETLNPKPLDLTTYHEYKHSTPYPSSSRGYQQLKAAVRDGPFRGWLVSGKEWESFDSEGRRASKTESNGQSTSERVSSG